jgi:transcriptional regulator with XRE-family HTH domain
MAWWSNERWCHRGSGRSRPTAPPEGPAAGGPSGGTPERTPAPGPAPAPVPAPLAPARTPAPPPPVPAQRELGLVLLRLRLEQGLSLRALARRMGYSAHSAFVDVEKGLRLPSEALVSAYEKCFGLPDGSLLRLRRRALVERAGLLTGAPARPADPPTPPGTPAPPYPYPFPPVSPPPPAFPSPDTLRAGRFVRAAVRLSSAALGMGRPRPRTAGGDDRRHG